MKSDTVSGHTSKPYNNRFCTQTPQFSLEKKVNDIKGNKIFCHLLFSLDWVLVLDQKSRKKLQ